MIAVALEKLRANLGASLFALNLLLLVIFAIQSNPGDLFKTGYEGAAVLLELEQSDVVRIEITDPDAPAGVGPLALVRGERLPPAQWKSAENAPEDWFGKVKRWVVDRRSPEYAWSLERAGARVDADQERVRDFFTELEKLRRYYAYERTPANDVDFGMGRDSAGRYAGLAIEFGLEGGPKRTLFVGRTSAAGAQSYVRLDDEGEIFQVESNLRSVIGSGEPDYFRDRRFFTSAIERDDVVSLQALFTNGAQVLLVRDGESWRMQSPPLPGAIRSEHVNGLLGEILGWKATGFPEALPSDADASRPFKLVLETRAEGDITARNRYEMDVLGRRNFSNYLVRRSDGALFEINSTYLEDLLDPERAFVETPPAR